MASLGCGSGRADERGGDGQDATATTAEAAPSESAAPTPTTTSPAPSTRPSTTAATTTEPPLPPTRFEPDKRYSADDVDLPAGYATDLGNDLYDDPRPQRIRGDLADYAHEVRHLDTARADQLAWRLQAIPFAVCVAAQRVEGGFEGYLARVDERVAAAAGVAEAFGVAPPSAPTPTSDPFLALAVAEARARFCPEHGEAVGDPLGVLPDWDTDERNHVDIEEAAIPSWAFPNWMDSELDTFAVAAAYMAMSTTPDLGDWVIADVVLFPGTCSHRDETYVQIAQPPTLGQYAAGAEITAEDVRGSLAGSLTGLATIELGCPADWLDI